MRLRLGSWYFLLSGLEMRAVARALALSGSLFAPACMLSTEGTAEPPSTFGGGGAAGAAQPSGGGGESAAGGAAEGGAAAGSGGSLSPEDCYDAIDDDGDGLVDCEDPGCDPTSQCVAGVAPGFGLVRIEEQAFPAAVAPEPCRDGSMPIDLFSGPAAEAQCSACSCEWLGASCTAPGIACYFNETICSFGVDLVFKALGPGCVADPPVPLLPALGSCQLVEPPDVVSQGTCTAAGGKLTNPTPWERQIRVCPEPLAGAGCPDGGLCVPKPEGAYAGWICIRHEGGEACPAGWTEKPLAAYEDWLDSRTCSPCGCSTASVACLGGGYVVHDDDGCEGDGKPIVSSTCTPASGLLDSGTGSFTSIPGEPTKGTCAGGASSGHFQPVGPQTLCCVSDDP